MLVILGFAMIAVFMALIMTKKLTPVVALIVVPTIFGLFAGAGLGIGDMVMDSMKSLTSTAALLMFAIVFFGMMIDVGLFDPLVKLILRTLGNDPAKVVVGTAVLAAVVSLDGDGSTTFILTTAAMLPIYLRLGLSPVVLTCVAGLANGTMNILPWGGPTARAAAALKVSPSEVFVPMIPSLIAGMIVIFFFAWHLGIRERRRLALAGRLWAGDAPSAADATAKHDGGTPSGGTGTKARAGRAAAGQAAGGSGAAGAGSPAGSAALLLEVKPRSAAQERFDQQVLAVANDDAESVNASLADSQLDPNRDTLRPKLFWFNLVLTVTLMVVLVMDVLPLPYVFMIGSAIALVVNFPKVKDQAKALVSHAGSIVAVVSMVMAAAVLTGVLSGTGMVDAMAAWLVSVIPTSMGPYMAVITGLLSIPMTFFMSNDAFYFGVLPVLSETAAHFGIDPAAMARASIAGQPVHMQSPLVPAILLLVSLSRVDLGDHHKKVLWRALVVSLVMLAVAIGIGVIPFG
ncbi:citrate/H+ symporter [Arthrobacter sp. PAMC 25486]|uniref:CitMHS family transporter n=1 Tax=Arthrobacter sp. PAMC 25486 TaxID=1494608 RepID=UPI0005360994|nr:CitMHS family transporter [Arthrobacter sp. PAMC 25486]AIY03547.1 citrate/H+ symporter [Arthrobacter sp. PAMC 25486]